MFLEEPHKQKYRRNDIMKTGLAPDGDYIKNLEDIYFTPIFILGQARSGTSLIYNMLSLTKSFNYLTPYHIIFYDQIIHNHINKREDFVKNQFENYLKKHNIIDRVIDKIRINADLAEEYQFLLLQKAGSRQIEPKSLPVFIEMARKIQFISENSKPLLIKTPSDFSNFIFIKKAFPNAKFIFIHRHPLRILNSTRIAGRDLYYNKSLYYAILDMDYNGVHKNPLSRYLIKKYYSKSSILGLIFDTRKLVKAIKNFLNNINKLSMEDYINVKYEDLCKDPNKTIDEIMNFLSLKSREKIDYKSLISPRNLSIENNTIKTQKMIYKSIKNYFDFFGYK